MDDEPWDDDLEPRTPLDRRESWLVAQDLDDLQAFEQVFAGDGTRGVSLWCHDCEEEHYYPWDLLRGSLETLLETGDVPVHEPAFAPDPDEYVPWEYARGYVDALRDVGAEQRLDVGSCARCSYVLDGELRLASFCPRCGSPLLRERLLEALTQAGLGPELRGEVLRRAGLPG